MAQDLVDHPKAQHIFARVRDVLGETFLSTMFDGPEDDLRQTRNTQPAIFVHSMALVAILGDANISMAAGHSLGEYSALVCAGSMTFEDALRIVRLRGELMQKAGEEQQGTMAAVIGLDQTSIENVCTEASASGIVQAANFNSPGQVVLSGSVEGVHAGMTIAKQQGAKLVKELVVSGAFHSPLMEPARAGLENALQDIAISNAAFPVYANVTAQPVQSAGDIRELLVRQVTSPVRWEETIRAMRQDGAETFIEVGPGKVLRGLAKRILTEGTIAGVDTRSDAEGVTV
jgi:[acyl-carrier-protein] S-malonyltransferase